MQGEHSGSFFRIRQNSAFQQEAKVNQDSDSIDIEDVTKQIDSLIQRGLNRVETEQPAVSILDYIRLLQLSPQMQREDDLPEIIWVDDLENFDLPEVA
jgi:DNA replication protein DnaD